ncbi:MAG: ATP-binding cassette domain-containing protein [Candidatus Latescibacteria bacterium]|nr:ATP-binding cassette domain-containing protein [Candidatus Latescibacterota bacterium]NIO56246.1 ATP-binding cassette domain-containing protein [Candidatus Latescibacterota bacterium]
MFHSRSGVQPNESISGGNRDSSLIRLQNVTKVFEMADRKTTVLRGVNLDIRAGEFVAITGRSGSGKSTLLNMLTGIDHPTTGDVVINSTNVHTLNESRLARWRGENIGIVFQFFQLVPTLSILENLVLAMDFVGKIPRRERDGRARELLHQVGILEHADKFPAALSGGEQQRAAIARALANDPPILVADEPTGNLDGLTARAIQELFFELAAQGKTVIIVTHENLSNFPGARAVAINDGLVLDTEALQARH